MARRYEGYREVSARTHIPVETLRKWRSTGYKGFDQIGVRMGKHIRFEENEVDDWLERLRAEQRVGGSAA